MVVVVVAAVVGRDSGAALRSKAVHSRPSGPYEAFAFGTLNIQGQADTEPNGFDAWAPEPTSTSRRWVSRENLPLIEAMLTEVQGDAVDGRSR